jgi:hypothetical protein
MTDTINVITGSCPVCGLRSKLEVPTDEYTAWRRGTLIQKAMPSLNRDERELLITGTHPACWAAAFDPDNAAGGGDT